VGFDEADSCDSNFKVCANPHATTNSAGLRDLQARLFNKAKVNPRRHDPAAALGSAECFCDQADAAVVSVEQRSPRISRSRLSSWIC